MPRHVLQLDGKSTLRNFDRASPATFSSWTANPRSGISIEQAPPRSPEHQRTDHGKGQGDTATAHRWNSPAGTRHALQLVRGFLLDPRQKTKHGHGSGIIEDKGRNRSPPGRQIHAPESSRAKPRHGSPLELTSGNPPRSPAGAGFSFGSTAKDKARPRLRNHRGQRPQPFTTWTANPRSGIIESKAATVHQRPPPKSSRKAPINPIKKAQNLAEKGARSYPIGGGGV